MSPAGFAPCVVEVVPWQGAALTPVCATGGEVALAMDGMPHPSPTCLIVQPRVMSHAHDNAISIHACKSARPMGLWGQVTHGGPDSLLRDNHPCSPEVELASEQPSSAL